MIIDLSRPYGEISPHHHGALFEQDGLYYDSSGKFMPSHPDNKGKAPKVTTMPKDTPLEEVPVLTALQVLATMNDMSYFEFRAHAERTLKTKFGRGTKKADILQLLENEGRKETKVVPMSFSSMSGGTEQINLTAWAKGEQEYLAAEVFSAISQRYDRRVSNIHDAVECLIEEKVVHPKDARTNQ